MSVALTVGLLSGALAPGAWAEVEFTTSNMSSSNTSATGKYNNAAVIIKLLKSVGMMLAKVKERDGMMLAKVKEQDGMMLAKVKEQDGMMLAKVKEQDGMHRACKSCLQKALPETYN